MVALSINVNKVATLRNSRGGDEPNLLAAVEVCLAAGARGITVHPRADERHITRKDVHVIAERLAQPDAHEVEFNIEGDPRPDWIELVQAVRPHQATLVPVRPGEITSEAGWPSDTDRDALRRIVSAIKGSGSRVSIFVDPVEEAIDLAKDVGGDRVELYTEPFAAAFARGLDAGRMEMQRYVSAAERAHALGLGINAGHDLDLNNLPLFLTLPHLAEVSIGHALMSRALFEGLASTVREYLALVED